MYLDSHAHLDMARGGEAALEAQLGRAREAGLVGIVTIAGATRVGEYVETLALAERVAGVWVAAGIHPHTGSGATPDALEDLRRALDHPKVVGLGEIGLDYHYDHSPRRDQRRAFERQLEIAHDAGLPVVIHTREADDDTLAILGDGGAGELGGVIHCFSSGERLAREALAMGLHLSFSGIVTFPKAESVREVARVAPGDRILAETDSPFLSPVPFRGKPNEPARVVHVVEELASLRGAEVEEMGRATVENAARCFGLDLSGPLL